ncbi:hypothetical protein [Streptomyces nigrescens]
MNGPTVWVLALFGLISLVLVMGAKLANDAEQFFAAWIDAYQRLRERLRRRDQRADEEATTSPADRSEEDR